MSFRPGWKTYTLLGLILAPVLAVLAAVTLLPWQQWADDRLREALMSAGFKELELQIESIGMDGVALTGIEMPGGCHAGKVAIRPGFKGTDVVLQQARLQIEQREDGLWFCGAPLGGAKKEGSTAFAWPSWLGAVSVNDTEVAYQAGGIKGKLLLKGKASAGGFTLEAAITPAEDAALVPVTAVEMTMEGVFEGPQVTVEGKAHDISRALQATFTAAHALDKGEGNASFYILPVKFQSGGTQPDQLFPVVRGIMGVTQGTMSLEGTLGWTAEGMKDTDVKLLLADVAAVVKGITMKGLQGEVTFDSLSPVTTPPKQTLRVAEVDAGLPLSEGVVTFQLKPKGMLELEGTRWSWAGGELSTNPFSFALGTLLTDPIVLEARDLDLAAVLALALKEGLKATGVLTGHIPIMIKDGMPMLNNATLKVTEPGVISYTPDASTTAAISSNMGSELLMKALQDFRFTMLELTLNSQDDSTMNAFLKIQGANPALYDGKPIHLNINLTIEYADLLRHGLQFMRLPETLQESLGQ